MRDILVALVILALLPFSLFRPEYGAMAYAWVGLMNPHRLSWRMADAPVGLAVYAPFALTLYAGVPANTTQEFIDLAKATPGKINFSSPGTGTP